ncbi:hypothetical protein PX554_06530 [Sphingomonas sp. H39-1-10]|uniref:hypothetical protein n=1 Tax=Sphingomonas pollutisoli TaxID=3030829 RepID=UPI0023B8DB71|nr:hypothetical protein [Sphingomonas pollutisoli]MDF0487780.1 hypothetical protein [Sphingomonas pollutisoli]
MHETYLAGSFAFACTNAEMALLEEAFQAASDLMTGFDPGDPSEELIAILPPIDPDDRWSGLRDLFGDPAFPAFGAALSGGNSLKTPAVCDVQIFGATDFQPEPIAKLVHRCCQTSLQEHPIGFEWGMTCSKPWSDEFGGGWCAIHADRIELHLTREGLAAALQSENPTAAQLAESHGIWGELAGHPVEDWQYEVANSDTRLGYWDWVVVRQAVAVAMASDPIPD